MDWSVCDCAGEVRIWPDGAHSSSTTAPDERLGSGAVLTVIGCGALLKFYLFTCLFFREKVPNGRDERLDEEGKV